MGIVLTIVALIGLVIFVVGAILHLLAKPNATFLMVLGGLIWAIAQIISLLISIM